MTYISRAKRQALQEWMEDKARMISRESLPLSVRSVFDHEDAYGVALGAMMAASEKSSDPPYIYASGERAVIDAVRAAKRVGRTYPEGATPSPKHRQRPLEPYDPRYQQPPGEAPQCVRRDAADPRDPIAESLSGMVVDGLLSRLKPRTAEIVRLWVDGWTDREIAARYGLSHVRIVQLRVQAAGRLRKMMEEDV